MRLPLLTAVLLLAALPARTQPAVNTSGGPLRGEQAAVDVSYYDLDLAIRPADSTIAGTLAAHLRIVHPTNVLLFDLDDALEVRAVEWTAGGTPLPFGREPGTVLISLGRTYQPGERVAVRIAYGGTPRVAPNPPWAGGFTWATTADGRPWVGVSCQGEGADLWWPTKDHPSDEPDSMRIALTVPAGLTAVANGRLRERRPNGDGTETFAWHVSHPINNYGVTAYVAPYVALDTAYTSTAGDVVPVAFHVLPERAADARRQLPQFLDHMAFLEATFGPYPFRRDGYKVIHAPYLGMEHQSAIAYGDDFTDNAAGFDWLHFHELAHEWWANLLTAADWRDFWIHEGFAEYAEALYAEHLAAARGEDAGAAYRAYLAPMRGRILNRRPIAPLPARTTRQVYFSDDGAADNDIYYKGAWFLHTLRWTVGDVPFFAALRRLPYPDAALEAGDDSGGGSGDGCAACRFVSTADVQAAFEAASGHSLAGLFDTYLRRPALPQLVAERNATGLVLRWLVPGGAPPDGVLPDSAAFEVPVEVESEGRRYRVAMAGGAGVLPLPPGAGYRLDPDGWLLMDRPRVGDGAGAN